MLNVHRTAIVAAQETTADPNPLLGNPLLAENLEMTPLETEQHSRDPMTNRLGTYDLRHSGLRGRVAFSVELTPPKVKGQPPVFNALLLACGYTHQTVAGTTTQQYTLDSDITASLTIMVFNDGLFHRFTGSRGNVRFVIKMHETPKMYFEFMGKWNNPLNAKANGLNFDQSAVPVIIDSNTTSLTVGEKQVPARLLEIDTGNSVNYMETLNSQSVLLSNRRSAGNLSFTAGSTTEFSPTLMIRNNERNAHEVKIIYPSQQSVAIKLPHVQWHQHAMSAEENQWFHRVALAISDNQTDVSPITLTLD